MLGERRSHQILKLRRLSAALATDAKSEHLGVNDQTGVRSGIGAIGDADLELASAGKGCAAGGKPARGRRLDLQPDVLASQQRAHDWLGCLGVLHVPSRRRIVEREPESHVPSGGDGGGAAKDPGDLLCQAVGPAMAAQQRHHHAAILGDDDDGRLGALVLKERRQSADHDPAGAQRDDRAPGGEQSP